MRKENMTLRTKTKERSRMSRVIALWLCAVILLSLLPTFALAEPNESVIISGVDAPVPAEYTVDKGAELASVGLPEELGITIEDATSVRTESVKWVGDYNKDAAGTYTLTAAFVDETLAFSPMPTVQITVAESAVETQDPPAETEPTGGTRGETAPESAPTTRGEINYSAVCKLIPIRPSYATGESIQFTLNAQYATPGDPDKPQTVKFGIPIPNTTPAVQLPMFYATGSGAYAGVPMYPLTYSGVTTEIYLMTGSGGQRWIEFTLDAGSTVQGVLSMILPNGVSDNVRAFTLAPSILSTGDYGTNTLLEDGTTAVTAEFGWHDVNKIANTDNIGVIGATTKDPDRITYTITADSQSSGLATGRIFTERYSLNDTINLFGLHYADGALTQSEANGISTFSIGGTPVLEIAAPLSRLSVAKQVAGGLITAFTIEYNDNNPSIWNTDGSAVEMPNLNLSVTLLLSAMQLNPGTEETKVTNTAEFDAYSPFGDHHESSASHTAYTEDRYGIEKTVYNEAECLTPATQVFEDQVVWYKIVAENKSSGDGPFSITDELPAGMVFQSATPITPTQSGQTLTWNDVTIPSAGTYTIYVAALFDATKFVSNPVHNTVVLRKGGQRLASDFADIRYLSGIIDTSSIIYEKSVNKTSVGKDDTLRYTITARNEETTTAAKRITITDKWPGANVRPTAILGCTDYALFDEGGNSYTLEEVRNATSPIEITKIQLYNVLVPKGGGRAVVYIDGIVTNPVTELKNEIIGSLGQNLTSVYSVGVGISKAAYEYDGINGIGDMLKNTDVVLADDIVCYQMTVKNLTDTEINNLTLTDKLPVGLTPVSGTVQGVSGKAIIKHQNNTYASIALTSSQTPYTTGTFDLAAKEQAIIYLFAEVSQTAITNSKAAGDRIINAAYVNMPGGLVTGDATANIYTYVDTTQAFYIKKAIVFVADFDEDLTIGTTPLLNRVYENALQQWKKNDIVWNGAYVGYQFELINRNDTGANQDPVRVYELIDNLPEGMEFVGVSVKGNSDSYTIANQTASVLDNLGDSLIRDGETGYWSNDEYEPQEFTCNYDKDTNKVHITFNQSSIGALSVKYSTSGPPTNRKPYIYLIARVKDDAKQTLYRNTVDAKVGNTVELNKLGDNKVSIRDGSGENVGYRLISNYVDTGFIVFKPGIAKNLLGHYFPQGSAVPENVKNEDSLFPGETLRFQLQVGAGVVSGASANRIHASLQDFVVTDILPAEYVYRPKSATITLNAQLDINNGTIDESGSLKKVLPRGSAEPAVEHLADGRTKLTWDFSGVDRRLFVSNLYCVHLITYDVDWNTAYAKNYGNYTNQAAVTHSYDFSSVYSGTPDYDKNTISANVVVNVFGAAGTAAIKAVTNDATPPKTVTGSDTVPYVPVSGVGAKVTYTLRVKNATIPSQKSQTQSLVIIDELPRAIGDTGVVNRISRGAQFSVLFDDTPEVSVYKSDGTSEPPVDQNDYVVRFGNSVGRLNSTGDWSGSDSGNCIEWVEDSDGKNAVRIAFDPDFFLESGESIIVQFSARAGGDADPGEIAWNSYGYAYKSKAEGVLSERIYAEPPRVGIGVPGATLSVTKMVVGDVAPAAMPFTFLLKQNGTALADVKYTLDGSTEEHRTDADGRFTLTAAQTAILYVAPGSGYTVEETSMPVGASLGSITAAASNDGTDNGSVFTFRTLADGDGVGAIYTNRYATPPERDLTVRKNWTGQTNPNQPASIQVQLYKGGIADGNPVTLDASNSWQYTWPNLATAENWTVDELGSMPGYTKTITGDSVNGFTITNFYSPTPAISAEIQAEKAIDGDPNPPDETFSFRLTAESYTAPLGLADTLTAGQMPMPYGSASETMTESIVGEGNVTFGRLIFRRAGTYVYSIREDRGLSALYTYDDSVYNLTYTVVMDSAGTLSYTMETTKIGSSTNPSAVVFTNTYTRPTGHLTVSKTVTNGGDVNALFTFRFTFSEDTRYAYVTSDAVSGDIATGESLQLKHGQSVTITIHRGVTYTVVEDAYLRYIPTPTDRTFSGTISATESKAEYSNQYDPPYVPTLTGDLTIQKRVTGDIGDRKKDFAFTVVFDAPGIYHYNGSKTGTITSGGMVLLRHGEYITIANLPAGTTYSVTESGNSGYRVYTSGDAGIIAANGISIAAFTNSRSTVPLTGDNGAFFTGSMLMLGSLVCGTALIFVERYRKRRRRRARLAR